MAGKLSSERRALQVAVAMAATVPVTAGLAGVFAGPSMVGPLSFATPSDGIGLAAISLDSHVRYLSGLLLGIGLAFLASLPRIQRATATFRLLTAIVFVGGLARLFGLVAVGVPSRAMVFGLVMELGATPLLCMWQGRIARQAAAHATTTAPSSAQLKPTRAVGRGSM